MMSWINTTLLIGVFYIFCSYPALSQDKELSKPVTKVLTDLSSEKAERLNQLFKQRQNQTEKLKSLPNHQQLSDESKEAALLREVIVNLYTFEIQAIESFQQTAINQTMAAIKLQKAQAQHGESGEKLYDILENNINPTWRRLLEQNYNVNLKGQHVFKMPRVPPFIFDENAAIHQEALEKEKEVRENVERLISEEVTKHFELLVKAGQLRSEYFENLEAKDLKPYSLFNPEHLLDIQREVLAVPYRWSGIFHNKAIEIQKKWRQGPAGYRALANDLLFILMIFLIPFLTWLSVKRFLVFIDGLREKVIKERNKHKSYKALALWIQRLTPFIPWLIYLIGLHLAESALMETTFNELALFFPYFRYYLIYRISRRVIMLVLTNLSAQGKMQVSQEVKKKITKSSKLAGLFLFVSLILVHSFESVVTKGIVYHLSVQFIMLGGFFLLMYLAQIWKKENSTTINQLTHGRWFRKISELNQGNLSYVTGLPLFFISLILIVFHNLRKWGDEFEISRRVSARFFRKQLESSEKLKESKGEPVPEDYISSMTGEIPKEEILIRKFKEGTLDVIKKEIDEWLNEQSDEHSLAIHGDSGIGKSTFLKIIENHYKDLNIISARIPPKLITKEQVTDFFGKLLDVDISKSYEKLIEVDKERTPTLILLDKTHNMFLSRVGGFEGYREFINLINAQTENLFWCASFHTFSWRFLDTVFRKNQYFRVVKNINRWTEEDIKNLILSRHKKTPYELSYDNILEAAKGYDDYINSSYIESKFFRLLWEQAQGNPKSAINLWFSSLRLEDDNKLLVGLPDLSKQTAFLSGFPDETLFVYTALITHENLTVDEATEVTNLAKGEVNYALKVGLENDILTRDEHNRYQVNPLRQNSLINQLKKKNFIYGN